MHALRAELSWTHLRALACIDDPLKRSFCTELCRLERWSSPQLQERMASMLYERSTISRQPEETIRADLARLRDGQDLTPALVLKDPHILDFLGLNDRYRERDLGGAVLRDIAQFLLELGAGFTFIALQKRIVMDDEDFYIDLLFFNRKLRPLVVIELKLGDCRGEHALEARLHGAITGARQRLGRD